MYELCFEEYYEVKTRGVLTLSSTYTEAHLLFHTQSNAHELTCMKPITYLRRLFEFSFHSILLPNQ